MSMSSRRIRSSSRPFVRSCWFLVCLDLLCLLVDCCICPAWPVRHATTPIATPFKTTRPSPPPACLLPLPAMYVVAVAVAIASPVPSCSATLPASTLQHT
ncbi:hypothetical protein BD626DRAFT_254764 [Schizophyllum amplum]|uniref:Secreted peptide n=1 Tax=Schizophyllum amplum TaxID=97359 RepID=A0A550CIK7_9AGAR|nr:hypothetical protein BD626DRAFT_254764 [Auriculariopsis ampla]